MKYESRQHFEECLAKALQEDLRKDVVAFKKPAPKTQVSNTPDKQVAARQERNRQAMEAAKPGQPDHEPKKSPLYSAWGENDAHAPAYVHAMHTQSLLDPKNPKHDKWRKLYQDMADAHKALHNAIPGNVKIGEDEKK